MAAAVAAMTVGLSGARHITKLGIFTIGSMSVIKPAGIAPKCRGLPGNGRVMKGMGVVPMVQLSRQPLVR
jgi:hypothetical protein